MTQGSLFRAAETPSNPVKTCDGCRHPYEPYARREADQRFCSPSCSDGWHNAQKRPAKRTRVEKVLARLRQGKATGLELFQAGSGTRYGARIKNLRDKGYRIHGPVEVDIYEPGQTLATVLEAIPKTDDGHELYELREK